MDKDLSDEEKVKLSEEALKEFFSQFPPDIYTEVMLEELFKLIMEK